VGDQYCQGSQIRGEYSKRRVPGDDAQSTPLFLWPFQDQSLTNIFVDDQHVAPSSTLGAPVRHFSVNYRGCVRVYEVEKQDLEKTPKAALFQYNRCKHTFNVRHCATIAF
jgi:hypothetical protein